MLTDGQKLRQFIENQSKSIKKIYTDLGLSKQGFYNYFDSVTMEPETKKKIEKYFGKPIFALEVNIDPKSTEDRQIKAISVNEGDALYLNGAAKNDQELTKEALLNLTFSDKARAAAEKDRAAAELIREENNRKIINHLTSTADVQQESSKALDSILPGLQRILVEFGMGRLWKNEKDGQLRVSKLLFGTGAKADTKHTHDGSHK